MKEELLKELLEKYYSGDTSLEEEHRLREYFSGDVVLPGYEAEIEIFRLYSVSGEISYPDDILEGRIKDAIDHLEEHHSRRILPIRRYALVSIAAGLMILAVSYFMLRQHAEPEDTYSDPRLAYAETIKILNEVSVKLNKGTAALKPVSKMRRAAETGFLSVSKSASLITENLKPISRLNRISEVNQEMINNK
jgi:hypothetical protein